MADVDLRAAIIGCGVIAPTHIEAIASVAGVELVAMADSEQSRLDKLASKTTAQPYIEYQEMLHREKPDLVAICTPSGYHAEHAIAAMRSGAHVLIEKPLDITREALDRVEAVQRETGVVLSVVSQHRFDPASQQIAALLAEGEFGRLVLGTAIVPWWRSAAYYESGAWRGTWALDGGGVLMNQAIHSIDLLLWFMGEVETVAARVGTLAHTMETEDVASAVLRFRDGALGTIAATTGAFPGMHTRIEVFGDKGSTAIENDQLAYLHLARDQQGEVSAYGASAGRTAASDMAVGAAADPAALSQTAHASQYADVVRAIRAGTPPLVDLRAGRRSVELILAIYESARTGHEVVLS